MNLDVLVLALASAPRPAGIAALYSLLSAPHPRRVLVAYLVAGLTFSVSIGVLFVAIFHGSAISRRPRNPTVTTASVAGVATHVPGLFYLVALNAIVAEKPSLVAGVLQVLLFNAIWFGAAIASVVIFLLRPGVARRTLARVDGWARRRARIITVLVFAVAGSYLAIRGVVGLGDRVEKRSLMDS